MTAPISGLVIPELLQGKWTTALMCTYGADLTFFETRLLGQLAEVPLRIVLADDAHLAESFAESARTGQRRRFANKTYVAAPVRHPRAAHGKLITLLGPSSGLLIVGSGNLGYEGYAAPGELWNIYAYSDERPKHLQEFAAARSYIEGLCNRGLLDSPVVELLQTAWGQAPWIPPGSSSSATLRSNLNRPLIDQLEDAVSEPVVELVAHAPFHDADCAALKELIQRFQPKQTRLLLTDATSADPASIERVMNLAKEAVIERVHVKSEPGTYIHAKWVHLIHEGSETLLTGSANLSRTALLRSADNGNVELGIISGRARGSFDPLYAHLGRCEVEDLASLNIGYQGAGPDEPEEVGYPVVLWSRVDDAVLTIVFDRPLQAETAIEVEDYAGIAFSWTSMEVEGAHVRFSLEKDSADRLAEGGRIRVRLDGDDAQTGYSWPYHLAHLRGRLDKAGQRDRLQQMGDLPEQDAELHQLLQELEATLIVDRSSVWRIAKGNESPSIESNDDLEKAIRLEDLDWTRVRRDLRYSGYFGRGAAGVSPTDIQLILAAIGGRLGELDVAEPNVSHDEADELAREGDITSSDVDDDSEDELEDELIRRRLPISTRTRMAFDRFSRRYAEALDDSAFVDELGLIPAVTNAVVFNHLLVRLLERRAVSPRVALGAQLATWGFLWGGVGRTSILARVDDEVAEVVGTLLEECNARVTTLRGLAAGAGSVAGEADGAALRELARWLAIDKDFGLDCDLLEGASGSAPLAGGILDSLSRVAAPEAPSEIIDLVVAGERIARGAAHWRHETVRRAGANFDSTTFVVTAVVDGLTLARATELLGKVVVAASFAGQAGSYWRIRFEGNGGSVAFWDNNAQGGVVMVNREEEDLDRLDVPWPRWVRKIELLRAELGQRALLLNSA